MMYLCAVFDSQVENGCYHKNNPHQIVLNFVAVVWVVVFQLLALNCRGVSVSHASAGFEDGCIGSSISNTDPANFSPIRGAYQ
jgi:hypothetical protein